MKDLSKFTFFKDRDVHYNIDSLTKLLNRDMVCSYISYLIDEKIPFSVAISDIDNFKNINDNYGHMTGDKALEIFAKTLEESVQNGVVGRFGGDEFITVLEGVTEYNDIWEVFHKLNEDVSKIILPIDELTMTVTTGISRYPIDGKTVDSVLETADKALYRGKMKGRNCFIIYLKSKHAKIFIKRSAESVLSSPQLINNSFDIVLNDKSIDKKIDELLKFLSNTFMFDHIAIQSDKIVKSVVYSLSPVKTFDYVDNSIYINQMDSNNIVYVNNRSTLLRIGAKDLHKALHDLNVTSCFATKISCKDKNYGILRVDMCNSGRVWQKLEMDILIIVARLIGMNLYKEDKDLNNL